MITKEGLSAWARQINLDWIVRYHTEVRRLMRNEIVSIKEEAAKCSDEKDKRRVLRRKDDYLLVYERMLRVSSFITMYSYLEEFLYHA